MRLRREQWAELTPEDVEWVTEWQLAAGFRWLPLESERTVSALRSADPDHRTWTVTVRAGEIPLTVDLPLRDLARVVYWCHSLAAQGGLAQPPAPVRASMLSLRAALRGALRKLDPLGRMGYPQHETREP